MPLPYFRKTKPRNPAQELRAAARLLRQAARFPDYAWLQGGTAQDAQGQPAAPESPQAARRCALGQLLHVGTYAKNSHAVPRLIPAVAAVLPPPYAAAATEFQALSRWNDAAETTPGEVRQAFRQAAQNLDAQAAALTAAQAGG